MNNFILNGFDRSGTSAISRTLASHPEVELIFRPFNSGPIRKKMYVILDNDNVTEREINFFNNLENEKLDSKYFVSQWHHKYSSVKDSFKPNHLHLIISNLNHLTTRWINSSFPKIEQWAIWRNPIDILNSCIKNKFYGDWYSDALKQLIITVNTDEKLFQIFGKWINDIETENIVVKTAFLIAVRNYFLFSEIKAEKFIDYEIFKDDPNKALLPVLKYFKLNTHFDFNEFIEIDLNSIPSIDGYRKNKISELVINTEDLNVANELFKPLNELYKSKFKV